MEKASNNDIDGIMSLFDACRIAMRRNGIFQWPDDYPVAKYVAQDIEQQSVYVVKKNGKCIATITLNEQQDKQYATKDWQFESDRILVIHRLAVHPEAQGQGWAKKLCFFTENFAKAHNYKVIRLDAFTENPISNHLYLTLGYRQLEGKCTFHGKLFYCYEKLL